jgi:adenylate cyclase
MASGSWLHGLLDRASRIGEVPGDSEDERLAKATLTLLSLGVVSLAFVWVVLYFRLGRPLSAVIPLGYQVVTVIGLLVVARTKRFGLFRAGQLLMMLILPFLLAWSLGGFVQSSAVMLWAVVAPLGALVFEGPERAMRWLAGFLALSGVSGVLEPSLARMVGPIPQSITTIFFVLNIAAVASVAFLFLRYFVRKREEALIALSAEREKSERLLLNILPGSIAQRLKEREEVIADGFDEVSVLFADLVGFTSYAEKVHPSAVVTVLNDVFSAFDHLADSFGLEKIKTIGDAYMVVGGLPLPRPDHIEAVADMALEMRDLIVDRYSKGSTLSVRIGVHTGPVVAGVIGRRKFAYDLWGDTVNTASRMESHGVSNAIQVTQSVYEKLKSTHIFEPRGEIEVRGKGRLNAYLLQGRRDVSISSRE